MAMLRGEFKPMLVELMLWREQIMEDDPDEAKPADLSHRPVEPSKISPQE